MHHQDILPGQLPKSFLYPAQSIFEHDGKVQIHIDEEEELQIDFSSERMSTAIQRAEALAEEYPQPRTNADIWEMIEGIGEIVFEMFGAYSKEYMKKFIEFQTSDLPEEEKQKQLYQIVYGEDTGNVLDVSDIETGGFICSEFAAVGAVLCHTTGLRAYLIRSPVVIFRVSNFDANAKSIGGGGGHSSVVVVDENDFILGVAEFSKHRRYSWERHLWQNTMKNLCPITVADLRQGKPLVVVNATALYVFFMGDPLQFGSKDYFQHSQYEGIDTNLRKEAAYRLYDYYKDHVVSVFNTQPFCAISRFFQTHDDATRRELFLKISEDEEEQAFLLEDYDWLVSHLGRYNNPVFVWLEWRRFGWCDRFMFLFG